MKSLIESGKFTLSSGQETAWRFNEEGLSDETLDALAKIVCRTWIVGLADQIVPAEHGGIRFANALRYKHAKIENGRKQHTLVVDDVFTSGRSMERERLKYEEPVIGLVILERKPSPTWVYPIFTVNNLFWL